MSRHSFLIILGGILTLTACNPPASSRLRPTQQVVATFLTAQLVGDLVQVDGCLRVNDRNSDASYLLVWPPDLSATIEKNNVRVVSGIITGDNKEVILPIGAMVFISGGETLYLDEQLQQNIPSDCQGPYWVVGNELGILEATKEP